MRQTLKAPHDLFRVLVDRSRSMHWEPPATYQDVAEDIGCSLTTLNAWMRGTHGMSPRWHHAVAEALGVPVKTLLATGIGGVSGRRREGAHR